MGPPGRDKGFNTKQTMDFFYNKILKYKITKSFSAILVYFAFQHNLESSLFLHYHSLPFPPPHLVIHQEFKH